MNENDQGKPSGGISEEECRAIWMKAPKRHAPSSLAEVWWRRVGAAQSVEKFIAAARAAVQAPELDDPATAPAYAARLMEGLLQPFERLVEKGKFDDVLPRLSALPILYSPHAGIGAGKWKHARRLYADKRVGTEGMMEYRGNDTDLARNPIWRHLAYDTVWAIQHAVLELRRFRELRASGTPCFTWSKRISEGAQKTCNFDVFLLPGGDVLGWPDWLNDCEPIPLRRPGGVPVPVAEAREPYLCAARAVLDNFFADPDHPYGEEMIVAVKGVRKELHRAQAVAEARGNVLKIIGRM